jgi:hypothetical protein
MQRIQEDIKLCLDNSDFKEELSAMKVELNPDLIAVKVRHVNTLFNNSRLVSFQSVEYNSVVKIRGTQRKS